LQGVQQLAGAPGRDAIVGQRGEDFGEHDLRVGESSGERSTGPEGIVGAENAFGVLLALVIAMVVEAEFLTAKSGRTAEDATELAMVAGWVRHGCLQKTG